MSPRRSTRLRGGTPGETPTKPQPHTMHRLSALAERDESPKSPIPYNMNSVLSSPLAVLRTPAAAGRIQPSRDQMHPSIAKQSTAKEPDSGLRLGFRDIDTDDGIQNSTPSKIGVSSPSSFDFRYARPTPQLSEEAQQLMDGLRDEAAKIKAKLATEHEEQVRNGGESTLFSARKMAQPKPKAGRYSDVHMAEFKKMDSIANHPSVFRGHPEKPTVTSSLKRSQSKAGLHEPENSHDPKTPPKQTAKSLKRSQSKAQLDEPSKTPQISQHVPEKSFDRLENAAPAKRARQQITDDVSAARPVSRGGIPVPTKQTTKPTFRSRFDAGLKSLTTPTKASAARASGLKQPSTLVSSISTSSSMANFNTTPRGLTKSKTANYLSSIPKPESSMTSESSIKEPPTMSKFDRFKSMLHRNPSPSKAGTSIPSSIPALKKSPTKVNLVKEPSPIPVTPAKDAQTVKHVTFTPGTVPKHNATLQETPSPKKSGIPRSATMMNMATISYPSLSANASLNPSKEIRYPELSTPRPAPEPIKLAVTEPRPAQSGPPMFTFRSDQTINFGSSPGQTSIRAVRPSVLPSEIPGSFPVSDHENFPDFPTIPHGMSNKKRRRASSEVDGNEETSENGQSPSKKLKSRAAEGQLLVENLQTKILPGGKKSPRKLSRNVQASPTKNASPSKGKGVLSLSRLNMLARPKNRK